jgi:hypothetical protein
MTRGRGTATFDKLAPTCTTSVGQTSSTEDVQIHSRRVNSVEKDERHGEANRRRDRGLRYAVIFWPWDGFTHVDKHSTRSQERKRTSEVVVNY